MRSNGMPNLDGISKDSEGVYQGKNWTYQEKDGVEKLTLTSGEWDFSNTHPADSTGIALSAVNCIVQINEGATVKGGKFKDTVKNGVNDRENNIRVKGGTIEGGKFDCNVYNYGGTIKNGEFTHCWNDNLDDAKGTIEGGTFDSNGMSASVTNYGIISGGTFNDLVTSDWKGVIEKGTFNGIVSNYGSISGGYFLSADNEYDTDSKVSGGVFKTIPSKVEDTSNLYKIQFDSESGADTTNTLSVDNHDFGMTSVYVVGKDDTELTVTAKDKILTSVNNKANTIASSYSITFKLGEVKLDDEKEGNAYLLKLNAKIYNGELVIGTDGKPVTEGRKPYGDNGVKGNGWTYDGMTLKLNPTEAKTFDLSYNGIFLKCKLEVGEKATVNGRISLSRGVINNGTIDGPDFHKESYEYPPKLTNNGTVKNCYVDYGYVTNNGIMENVSFVECNRLTNNEGAELVNVVIRTDDRNFSYTNNGSIDKAIFDYDAKLPDARAVKEEGNKKITASVGTCSYYVFGEQLYIIGEPVLRIKINDGTTIENVNGNVNYGGLTAEKTAGYQRFTVQSGNGNIVLNQEPTTTTYTLTVVDGKTSTGKTSEELKEGTEVAVDTNVPDDKVFTGWTASDGVTLTHNGEEVDLSENHLVFNMPAKTFTLTANFETARTNILFNENGTLNLDGVKDYEGDGWYYSEGALYLNPATATEYDFTHVNPQEDTSAELKEVNVVVWVNNNNAHIVGGTFAEKVCGNAADASIQNCTFKSEVNTNTPVKNCIFTKSSTITDIYIAENCLFEKKPDESIMTYELTEKTGATVTATLDGCEGEVSGTTLYFSGTPTLKVKVADGIVEKANDKDVGKADANGWYTVTAKTVMAEDDEQIVLTKGTSTPDPVDPNPTPNPDDQPKTYTVTVKGGKINNETEVKVEKDSKLTVDMDETEVPEGMTFDVWSISFPEGVKDTLTPSVKLHDPHMDFTMPEANITIEAQYRSSELPGEEDDGPSALGTMATVAVGGAAAGILVWQGVSLGVDSYLQLNLPQGVAVPTNRRELVVLLWETAGKPEAALPSLYSDVPAEEIELQKATRWAIDNGLVKPADDSDASRFDPDRYVTKYDVFGAWLKLKKLMK